MQDEHLKISEKVVNMAPELAQNGAQVGTKMDEKWVPNLHPDRGARTVFFVTMPPLHTQGRPRSRKADHVKASWPRNEKKLIRNQ